MTDEQFAAILALGAGVIIVASIIALVFAVLEIVANWKIFVKAGEEGWKAIIPFYASFITFKIGGNTMYFWIWLGATVLNYILSAISESGFIGILASLCSLVVFVFLVLREYNLAKSFGKGIGFTVGLVLLNPIFRMVLGFGSAEYQGVPEANK